MSAPTDRAGRGQRRLLQALLGVGAALAVVTGLLLFAFPLDCFVAGCSTGRDVTGVLWLILLVAFGGLAIAMLAGAALRRLRR